MCEHGSALGAKEGALNPQPHQERVAVASTPLTHPKNHCLTLSSSASSAVEELKPSSTPATKKASATSASSPLETSDEWFFANIKLIYYIVRRVKKRWPVFAKISDEDWIGAAYVGFRVLGKSFDRSKSSMSNYLVRYLPRRILREMSDDTDLMHLTATNRGWRYTQHHDEWLLEKNLHHDRHHRFWRLPKNDTSRQVEEMFALYDENAEMMMRHLTAELTKRQLETIRHYYWNNRSTHWIADTQGVTHQSVACCLHGAIKKMRLKASKLHKFCDLFNIALTKPPEEASRLSRLNPRKPVLRSAK